MKVKWLSLFIPIFLATALIIGGSIFLAKNDIEQSTLGYEYKSVFFQKDELGRVDIEVSESDWQSILDNPTAEEYKEATVTLNGETFEHVGIRTKGNSSLSSVASSDSDRYSLKIDFSQYNSAQTFYGLEKINLNNNFSDTTQMKEFVSYELMEQLGLATPAHSYVDVYVNGEKYGMMLAVEEVGEAFMKKNYGSTEGYLFKPESNGSDLAYISDDVDDYDELFDEVKVNQQTAKANSSIIEMMKEISEGDTSSLEVEAIAKYFALNTALVNMDSYQGSFKHNYYLYEDENGIFSIIPWDYNMSFGGFTGMGGGGNNRQNNNEERTNNREFNFNREKLDENQLAGKGNGFGGMMEMGSNMMSDTNINFSITEPVSGTTVDARPLLKIILEDEEARNIYNQTLEVIANTLLTKENVLTITTNLESLLYEAIDSDPTKFSTTEQFLEGINGESSLAQFAEKRSESILKQLAGEIEGISGASEGFGFEGMPNIGGENGQMQSPNIGGENGQMQSPNMGRENGQMQPPNIGGENGQMQPPNIGGENGQMQSPNMNGENGQMRPPNMGDFGKGREVEQKQNYLLVVISLVILVLSIVGILFISNRKYKRK